jgi:FkbM family methyltransferase
MFKKIKYWYRAYRFRFKIDKDEIKYVNQTVKYGDIVVDIGCHKGGYLFWMMKAIGSQGQAFAFEPQEGLFEYLKETVNLLGKKNVVIEKLGISSQSVQKEYYIPKTKKGNSPGARIDVHKKDSEGFIVKQIQTVSLDQYFLSKKIFPNFIKIDVEGHEKEVLLGGLELIKITRPIILMECENRHLHEETVEDIFNILLNLDYKGFFFLKGKKISIDKFSAEIHQKNGLGRFWEAKEYINNFVFEP